MTRVPTAQAHEMTHARAGVAEVEAPFSVTSSAKIDSPAVMRKVGHATDQEPPTRCRRVRGWRGLSAASTDRARQPEVGLGNGYPLIGVR